MRNSEGDRGQGPSEKTKERSPRKLEEDMGVGQMSCGLVCSGHCPTLDPASLSGSGIPGQRQ